MEVIPCLDKWNYADAICDDPCLTCDLTETNILQAWRSWWCTLTICNTHLCKPVTGTIDIIFADLIAVSAVAVVSVTCGLIRWLHTQIGRYECVVSQITCSILLYCQRQHEHWYFWYMLCLHDQFWTLSGTSWKIPVHQQLLEGSRACVYQQDLINCTMSMYHIRYQCTHLGSFILNTDMLVSYFHVSGDMSWNHHLICWMYLLCSIAIMLIPEN